MLDSYIIIGLTIALMEIVKTYPHFKTKRGKLLVPILVFLLAGAVNTANAFVFRGTELMSALSDGFNLGAVAGGLYSMGQTYLTKSKEE